MQASHSEVACLTQAAVQSVFFAIGATQTMKNRFPLHTITALVQRGLLHQDHLGGFTITQAGRALLGPR